MSKRDKIIYLVDGNFSEASKAPRVQILFAKDNLSQHPGDFWGDISTTGLEAEGGVEFKNGKKPLKLLNRILEMNSKNDDFVLDFFCGSGTTFESLINLNACDGQRRKFIGIEQGEHFYDVLLKRLMLSINSSRGKAIENPQGYLLKYLTLESYEDTLNNLSLQNDPARDRALADNPALRQEYVLNYWLDVETQGSPSLLNVAAFRDPTAYHMRIKQPGTDVLRLQTIDLIETFNWLIGLWVENLGAPQTFEADFKREVDPGLPTHQDTRLVCKRAKRVDSGPYWFRLIEGYTLKVPGDESSRQKTLLIWRKLTDDAEKDNAVLQHVLMEKLAISPREKTFAVIYVNGSHTLPNPVVEGELTKVRLIEEAFHQAMWSQEGA
jgi:adenine-specific DNA-methyltransferase